MGMRSKVAIVTDSVACIPQELAEKYSIYVVPPNIILNGKVYRDGVDITAAEIYQHLKHDESFLSSSPSPGSYLEAYRSLSQRAGEVFCITLSSKFSAIYEAANLGKELFKKESRVEVEVFDSQTAAAAQGLVALAAARVAAEGGNLKQVTQTAMEVRKKVQLFGMLENLHYVARTGRVPKVIAKVGSFLNIKPILTVSQGEAHLAAIARNKRQGLNLLLKEIEKEKGNGDLHVAVMHADALEWGKGFVEEISSTFNCAELFLTEFTPIMGFATGPGLLGVAFYAI